MALTNAASPDATEQTGRLPRPAFFALEPRWLHPLAWWAWAGGVAVAASLTTNPLLLLALMGVVAMVVQRRRPDAPWARSFAFLIRVAVIVVVVRVVAQILFGAPTGTTVLVGLPGLSLPSWLAGVRLGGSIMLEPLLQALYDGLRLAAIIVAIGAAASLASPARVLKSMPAALYEVGVSVVVASTFLPQLVADVARVRANRRLRGRSDSGLRGVGGAMMPVLHGALDRSITVAAAMDSRGYGRVNHRTVSERRLTTALLLAGFVSVVIGLFLVLGTTGALTAGGIGVVVLGCAGIAASMVIAARRNPRTRYRPDHWHLADILTVASGVGTSISFVIAGAIDPAGMATSTEPPVWPSVPLVALVGIALASLPGFITPGPPREVES